MVTVCIVLYQLTRLVGNNFLIHLLKILPSFEVFLNHEFYSKYPVLTDVYNNGKAVLGRKLFCSFESVFEPARGIRDSQTSINNKDLGLLVKKEGENIWKDNGHFFLCFVSQKKLHNFFLKELKKILKSLNKNKI